MILYGLSGFGGLGVAQILDPSVVNTIASTIQQVEGYYPGSLAYTNNNPGNLIYVGQPGATQGTGKSGDYSFAYFPSYSAGLQALNDQIQRYAAQGLTISEMMGIYAPGSQSGNNPGVYAQKIADALGVDPNTPLTAAMAGTPGVDATQAYMQPTTDYTTPLLLGLAGLFGLLIIREA